MQKAVINPDVLKWAIENSHYSISQISKKINKPDELIEKWINGKEYPTYIQLEKIAYQILKQPVAIFFFPEPPVEKITQSFRTLPDTIIDNLSPHFIKILRKAKSLQLRLKELSDGNNPSSDFIFDNYNFIDSENILNASSKLRSFLNISFEEQSSWQKIDEALKSWRDIVEQKGIFIFKDAFKDSSISGFSLYDDKFPIIYLNNSLSKSRQIFTIFHELAHLLFKTAGIDIIDDSFIYNLSDPDKKIERYCNKFTAEFLVPEKYFLEISGKYSIEEEDINQIAKVFSVSREVILRKFYDLGKVSQKDYENLSEKWIKEAIKYLGEKGGGGNYYFTKLTYLGRNYLELAFKQYYSNKISQFQLAEYLDIKVNNISSLELAFQS